MRQVTDERKPVICPWCGGQMDLEVSVGYSGDDDYGLECLGHYVCKCGACTPTAHHYESCIADETYLAATATPPNLPLTLAELFTLDDTDAVWIVSGNGKIMAMGAECAQEWASEEHCLFFARKPTPEDIEAARKERNG